LRQLEFCYKHPAPKHGSRLDIKPLHALEKTFAARLSALLGKSLKVRFTNNSSTMISSKVRPGELLVRLHHMFINADTTVLTALASYLRGSRRHELCLDRFISLNRHKVFRKPPPGADRAHGRFFDLEKIRDCLSRAYFSNAVSVPVVWGRFGQTKGKRSIRLGSYSFADRVIYVHPILDQEFVPAYMVVAVVYHEMLHHIIGSVKTNGQRRVHTAEFRRRERAYIHYQRAATWEKDNVGKLLRKSNSPTRRNKAHGIKM
jgi:hypothetical protein